MKLGEAFFYAAATFLLGVIAVATLELSFLAFTERRDFFKFLQDIAAILTLGGPLAFVMAGFASAISRYRADWGMTHSAKRERAALNVRGCGSAPT